MHAFAPTLLTMLKDMANLDFSNKPAIKFMGMLRAELIQADFPRKLAEVVASSIDVQISDEAVDDEMLKEYAQLYARIVQKLHNAFADNGFVNADDALMRAAPQLTLKLE
jgi:hypothetical protein